MNKQLQLACIKIKQLSKEMTQSELETVIQDLKFPLGIHLAIMQNFHFIVKNGCMPTKMDNKIASIWCNYG